MRTKGRPVASFGWRGGRETTRVEVPKGTPHSMSATGEKFTALPSGVFVVVHETPRVPTHQPNVVHVDDARWRPATRPRNNTDRGIVRTGAVRPYHGGNGAIRSAVR